jgi:HD domain
LQIAATIALTHHEHYDGTGYPQGLAGKEIPLEGRAGMTLTSRLILYSADNSVQLENA